MFGTEREAFEAAMVDAAWAIVVEDLIKAEAVELCAAVRIRSRGPASGRRRLGRTPRALHILLPADPGLPVLDQHLVVRHRTTPTSATAASPEGSRTHIVLSPARIATRVSPCSFLVTEVDSAGPLANNCSISWSASMGGRWGQLGFPSGDKKGASDDAQCKARHPWDMACQGD